MYDSVLLPTDGSAPAAGATPHAISHAERYDATLHVLFVVRRTSSTVVVGIDDAARGDIETRAETAIRTIRDEAIERGVRVEGAVRRGEPHAEILSYAADASIDLVVMSTHGRTGVGRVLVGSVTERVLRDGTAPVLAVKR